jgi:hypothetical protein
MAFPIKPSGPGGGSLSKGVSPKPTPFSPPPSPKVPMPTPPPSSKPEDLSLFKNRQFVESKSLFEKLNRDQEFLGKAAGGSASKAKEIKDRIGSLLPKGSSLTKDWARKKAMELDRAIQFPGSAPKDPSFRNPKLNRKIRGVFKKYFNV